MPNCSRKYINTAYKYDSSKTELSTCDFTFNLKSGENTTLVLEKNPSNISCDIFIDTGSEPVLFDHPVFFDTTFYFNLKIIFNNTQENFTLTIKQSDCNESLVEYSFEYEG